MQKEREEAERRRQAEKEEFIRFLGGRSIREAAKVPDNITFVHGLPRDNNDKEFGSFTVYISKNGSCYHSRKGCCSASFPRHAFTAAGKYRPCSKCCSRPVKIPQW